eukprot:6360594-Alexandrium_andersonii.AAC.1
MAVGAAAVAPVAPSFGRKVTLQSFMVSGHSPLRSTSLRTSARRSQATKGKCFKWPWSRPSSPAALRRALGSICMR